MTDGPTHLVIIGLMASGKTTVGAAVAAGLGRQHRDSDADLLARTGRSARDIAATDGVDALHAMELDLMLDALDAAEPCVVSAAASVIDAPAGRAALAAPSVDVVWLRIDAATASERSGDGAHRPWHEDLADQAARRDPWFAAVADITVDATADPETISEQLLEWVGRERARRSVDAGPSAPA